MGVEDGGYKPTEIEQVMETDIRSENLGKLKNDDEFTRELADQEYKDREGTPINPLAPDAAEKIRKTGRLTENYLTPEEADISADHNIAKRLGKNYGETVDSKNEGKHAYEQVEKIAALKRTKKAVDEISSQEKK